MTRCGWLQTIEGMAAPSEPDHSRITHSRKRTVTRGHTRTPRPPALRSGGHWRTRTDTRGPAARTFRDREAPGSNPGPRPNLYSKSAFPELPRVGGSLPDHR